MQSNNMQVYRKEQIESTLDRLTSLKLKVTELRIKCEKLKNLQSEQVVTKCNGCRKTIIKGEEVTFTDASRKIEQYFHKNCFAALISYLK